MTKDEYLDSQFPTCPRCGIPKRDVDERIDPACIEQLGRHRDCKYICGFIACNACNKEAQGDV